MKILTELAEWQVLKNHKETIETCQMQDWFRNDPDRFARYSLRAGGILLDYSKNRINDDTLNLLFNLAKTANLPEKINALFSGAKINFSEQRPALHTALRNKDAPPLIVGDRDITRDIRATLLKMQEFTEKVRNKEWRGVTGKPIRDIVNIGIGGSYLGPLMATTALHDFTDKSFRCHFISNIDSTHLHDVLNQIDPEATLFIVSSKSFTTLETITNAKTLYLWLQNKLGTKNIESHFVAVTAQPKRAIEFGIPEKNIFPLWDWVGGRYSIWSAIGLPIALMVGMPQFLEMLEGAHEMDQHFYHAEFSKNMPVILALLGIWYINFFGAENLAIVAYSHYLHYFRTYLQQLDMESNGKTISLHGIQLPFSTGPVILGEQGCNGQHAFHQLLHQGPHFIPVDFILVGKGSNDFSGHHNILIGSALSQAQALMRGKSFAEALAECLAEGCTEEEAKFLANHKYIPGNRPSNTIFLNKMTPRNLGALLALYEHKIFVQGAIWNINSFDQWGVELGKKLLPAILAGINSAQSNQSTGFDSSTEGLIQHYKNIRDLS
jgi:glucose-6-phosphate isomerase